MMLVSANSAVAYVDQHFGINANYNTTNWIENQTNVNLTTDCILYAVPAKLGEKHTMHFDNVWYQKFEIVLSSVRWMKFGPATPPPGTPIMLDLGQNGIHLAPEGVGINYDFFGTGYLMSLQWVAAGSDDAFLAIDNNDNGLIDSGVELFGNGSSMIEKGGYAADGFEALAQYDNPVLGGNDDGYITSEDDVWNMLRLWTDTNANGISESGEITTLDTANLISLPVVPKENNRKDPAGNWLPLWNWATNGNTTGNNKHKMVDVFFDHIDN